MKTEIIYCKETVRDASGWSWHRCIYKAKRDGYCKIHHPEAVKARREAASRRYEEKEKRSPYYLLKIANERIKELEKLNADLERGK